MPSDRWPIHPVLSATRRLAAVSDTPGLDAQTLLSEITGKPPAWIAAHPELELTPTQASAFEAALNQLEEGTPLPYVLGWWEFYGLRFLVNPSVLIPRPETELLVDEALGWLRERADRRVVDVGTGSGCIAVALACSLPDVSLIAIDISPEALGVARQNVHKHHVMQRIRLIRGDLLAPVAGPVDLVVANLPYIPSRTLHDLPVFHQEPELALDGGVDGLDLIRCMLRQSQGRLTPGGALLLEIEASQGESAVVEARKVYPQAAIQVIKDLAGLDRIIKIQL